MSENTPDAELASASENQLDFFRQLAAVTGPNYTNTVELYSSLPAFLFDAGHADTSKPYRKDFEFNDENYTLVIKPANVVRKGDVVRAAFPGQREEIIKEVITKMATEDPKILRAVETANGSRKEVELITTHSRIRRKLDEIGRGWKLSEIHEGLEILSGCRVEIKKGSVRVSPEFGLLAYAYAIDDSDATGERSVVKIKFHPLFIQALRRHGFRQIHYGRLTQLRHPLARWLYRRISHHFTGAKKGSPWALAAEESYNITLSFILANSTMTRYSNLRDNVREVRTALAQLLTAGILSKTRGDGRGYDEDPRYDHNAGKRGRKPLLDVRWDLWLSSEIVDDIITANGTAKRLRLQQLRG